MKNYLITAGIALGVVLLTLTLMPQKVINSVTSLGAVSSPDINSPYFSFGGVRQWAGHKDGATSATTTPCAILSPAATSTLVYGSFNISSTSASASYIEMGKSATAYATTTSLATAAVAANVTTSVVSLRTAAGGGALSETFSPSTYLVVKVGGSAPTQINGVCNAIWLEN